MALLSNGLQAWVYEGCFPYPDIIAMDGSPLEKIENIRKVIFVMKDGKIYKQ